MLNRFFNITNGQLVLDLPKEINWGLVARTLFVFLLTYTILANAWVGDDIQITFRQIWNFINGDGITFNYDTRVQAFTHPLWFLILSYIGFFTGELFLTTILLSLILTLLAVLLLFKIEINSSKGKLPILSPIYALILSWAFCDYTTSGLENPLSYLLVGFLLYSLSLQDWEKHLKFIYIILALLVLNRYDYMILFLPIALVLIPKTKNITGFIRTVWPGALILGLWVIFATFYFGSPFPNTYFAKLNANYPIEEVIFRGRRYFSSLRLDVVTILLILSGSILSCISKNRIQIYLTVGIWIYIAYIYLIGGDFMQGRFFAILVYLSMGQIVLALANYKIMSKKFTKIGILVFSIILLHVGAAKNYPFAAGTDYQSKKTINGIHDERGFYFSLYGLFSRTRESWPNIVDQIRYLPSTYKTSCGFIGSYSLLDMSYHLIDVCALTDPFLSRLPAVRTDNWKIGHHLRKVPQEYGEFLLRKVDKLPDERLNGLLRDVNLVAREKLFSSERFGAIYRLNTGRYSDINLRDYQVKDKFIPITKETEVISLDSWYEELEYDNLPPIYTGRFKRFNGNLKIVVENPSVANEIEFVVGLEYEYDIYVNDKFVGSIKYHDDIGNPFIQNPKIKLKQSTIVESITLKTTNILYDKNPNFNSLHYLNLITY